MSNKKIFLSYSRRDTEYVSNLVEALRKQNFDVWFDKNIRTGTDWDDTIEQELKNADGIVLVLSKTSCVSENVKDEMSFAIGLDKPVIPIKIEDCDVPMRLARKQFVDFTAAGIGHEAGFERLVKDLHISLNEVPTTVAKGTFKPPIPKKSGGASKYIIGGVVAVVVLIALIAMLGGGDDNTGTNANPEWETANTSHTVNSYLNYIYARGTADPLYKTAQDSIESLMVYEGMVVYGDNTQRYFVKNLFTNMNGDVVYEEDDNQIPKKGDIITALNPAQIYDYETFEAKDGQVMEPGEKAKVVSVRTDDEGVTRVILNFPE